MAHTNGNTNLYNKYIYGYNEDLLHKTATDLCRGAGADLSNGGGIEEIKKFETFLLPEFKIVVYGDRAGKSLIFESTTYFEAKKINLLLENQHYLLIKSLTGAFGFLA